MKYPVFIEPGNDDGMLLDAKAVKGTYVVVETLDELNQLKINHSGSIIPGSLCYVVSEAKTYRYGENQWEQAKDESDISDLAGQVKLNKQNIDTIEDCINKNVVDSLNVTADKDNVNINTRTINLLNKETATDIDSLPLASVDNAGIMTAEDYSFMYDLQARIENLEGTTDRLLYTTTDKLKEITLDGNVYSPAFYINGELYKVKSSTEIEKVLILNLRDFIGIFIDNPELTESTYDVNFISNGKNYSKITINKTTITYGDDIAYNGSWVALGYRTIRFVDGEDIANENLVTYLKNNTSSLSLTYNISSNKATINGITYSFSNLAVDGIISREVSANNINNFVTTIYDKKGQQLYIAPFRGIAVVIDGIYHIWHYYPNEESGVIIGWKDDGVDTVQQFTNTASGIIKGSTNDGQIYAETNGTGSVNGWNALKNRVTNVENNKADNVLATSSNKGLLSASDYSKIQGIEDKAQVNILEGIQVDGVDITPEKKIINIKQGNNMLFQQDGNSLTINANIPDPVTIDSELSDTSINPVQNQVITKALGEKANLDVVQLKITSTNKLASDLVDDTNQNHKFVTASEKAQITTNKNNISSLSNSKQDKLSSGTNIKINGTTISTTASRVYGNTTNTPTQNLTNIQIEDVTYNIPVYGLTVYTPNYDITTSLTNITASTSNPTTLLSGETTTLKFTANSGYSLPSEITVMGATNNWNQTTGDLTITKPTSDITITISGETQASFTNIHVKIVGGSYNATIYLNNETINLEAGTEQILNDVKELSIYCHGGDITACTIDTTSYKSVSSYRFTEEGDLYYNDANGVWYEDLQNYLQDGCYISLISRD